MASYRTVIMKLFLTFLGTPFLTRSSDGAGFFYATFKYFGRAFAFMRGAPCTAWKRS